jgi:pimeloyl-ACP methyl ester carboxylesterase
MSEIQGGHLVTRRAGIRHALLACCALIALVAAAHAREVADGQTLRDVAFSGYGELSSNAELVRRFLSPLTVARSAAAPAGQAINIADERFVVYVPAQHAARGYGLIVFISPWQEAGVPRGWAPVLSQFGCIFVSAARSGNEEKALSRRAPLALLAAHNIIRQYPVDPERIYIAGLSGGARVALHLAVAYPDMFRGAILNAGSDPIGTAAFPLPPADLFRQFQSASHLVYVKGELDLQRDNNDRESMYSMRQWCAFGVDAVSEPGIGHAMATPAALTRALALLTNARPPDPARLAACRSAIDHELQTRLRSVESLLAAGQSLQAQQQLQEVDARFGGLAAPRSIELASGDHLGRSP